MTKEMLDQAAQNAKAYGTDVDFYLYDGRYLPFEDGVFDLVVSRNVLWNVEDPQLALQEWRRVLKEGGRMVCFDANWYLYLVDEDVRREHEKAHHLLHERFPDYVHDPLGKEKARQLEKLALKLPLTDKHRPGWDEAVLKGLGMKIIRITDDIGDRVFDEAEKIHYTASPAFMVCAEKV